MNIAWAWAPWQGLGQPRCPGATLGKPLFHVASRRGLCLWMTTFLAGTFIGVSVGENVSSLPGASRDEAPPHCWGLVWGEFVPLPVTGWSLKSSFGSVEGGSPVTGSCGSQELDACSASPHVAGHKRAGRCGLTRRALRWRRACAACAGLRFGQSGRCSRAHDGRGLE